MLRHVKERLKRKQEEDEIALLEREGGYDTYQFEANDKVFDNGHEGGGDDADLREFVRAGVQAELADRSRNARARRLFALRNTLIAVLVLVVFSFPVVVMRSATYMPAAPKRRPWPVLREPGVGVREHNEAVITRLEQCRSSGMLQNTSLPIPAHQRLAPADEASYRARGCGMNETTVVLLADDLFANAYASEGEARSEIIWARSTMTALKANGYAFMFGSSSTDGGEGKQSGTLELYKAYRDNVRVVLMSPGQVDDCYNRRGQDCLRSEENPDGINAWRVLAHTYGNEAKHPLGHRFTLSPPSDSDNTSASSGSRTNRVLPLSIEPVCAAHPLVPPSQRSRQAYLLANQLEDLSGDHLAWTLPDLADVAAQEDLQWISSFGGDDGSSMYGEVTNAGIVDLGAVDQEGCYRALGNSMVLVGSGNVSVGMGPWEALCMGVPFINPIMSWDEANPADRASWVMQQTDMADMNPPYVYPVHQHDLVGLRAAIRAALEDSIDGRMIPERMRFEYVRDKVAEIVEWDWREEARLAHSDLERAVSARWPGG